MYIREYHFYQKDWRVRNAVTKSVVGTKKEPKVHVFNLLHKLYYCHYLIMRVSCPQARAWARLTEDLLRTPLVPIVQIPPKL